MTELLPGDRVAIINDTGPNVHYVLVGLNANGRIAVVRYSGDTEALHTVRVPVSRLTFQHRP